MRSLTCEKLVQTSPNDIHACGRIATWVLVHHRTLKALEHLCEEHKRKEEIALGQSNALSFIKRE